ncbi:MAG: nickel-dependent hydrogenase large subunit [Campylobacterales bacterium]|nr:nickel-dependent hydrogenase large subunit [Campylobacterales bacterium]
MIERRLIERIEGEAELEFEECEGRVAYATIRFEHMRGMERLLLGREGRDALVLTPRVCGICGHAHLMACVLALEDAYANAGHALTLSPKAQALREATLSLEMIQNHIKWWYLVMSEELYALRGFTPPKESALRGAYGAQIINRAISALAGQWPHNSYMIPGGVTCDPGALELLQAQTALFEATRFVQETLLGMELERFLSALTCKEITGIQSDAGRVEAMLLELGMQEKGRAYDRFAVLGSHGFAAPARLRGTKTYKIDPAQVHTEAAITLRGESMARNALYRGTSYETGPLARALQRGDPLIKNMHRRFRDSTYTRIFARLYECALLLERTAALLRGVVLGEASWIEPPPIERISAEGVGIVEAPRGPLIHRVRLERGIIAAYEIITPTQWNLASAPRERPGPAQKAMEGLHVSEAAFVFRSFDVCSVCTTH